MTSELIKDREELKRWLNEHGGIKNLMKIRYNKLLDSAHTDITPIQFSKILTTLDHFSNVLVPY